MFSARRGVAGGVRSRRAFPRISARVEGLSAPVRVFSARVKAMSLVSECVGLSFFVAWTVLCVSGVVGGVCGVMCVCGCLCVGVLCACGGVVCPVCRERTRVELVSLRFGGLGGSCLSLPCDLVSV